MKLCATVLAALLPTCSAVFFSHSAVPSAEYPVSRVVELLRNMKAELEKEGDADEEVYEKLACWCETNDKEKTKAIAEAEGRLQDLQAAIERNGALSATLKVEIDGLEKEIARNQESLATATALREKQKADFIAEEKEMVQSIQALRAAVTVLSKHHTGASLLSMPESAPALATIRTELKRHEGLLRGVITPHQRHTLSAIEAGSSSGDYFDSAPTFKQAYAPQSGEIFGILRQMAETFETDLAQSQKEEVDAQQAYDEVKSGKEEEIRAGQASHQDKGEQLAKADEAVAQARADREDTRNSLSADEQFLLGLKKKCSMTDEEWEDRQRLRAAELVAVSEAIAVLSSDDARELFSTTFKSGGAAFMQIAQVGHSKARGLAAGVLSEVALRTGSPRLSALATSVKLDAFERVKRAIDEMIGQLTEEKADEVRHRDLCISELNTNQRSTGRELHHKKNVESQIMTLEMKIRGVNSTINTLSDEIDKLGVERGRAQQDRLQEKTEFDRVLAEQKQAEGLLQQAYKALKSQYAAKETGLVQQPAFQGAAPRDFTAYGANRKAPGVLSLIEHILENCQQMQDAMLKAEGAARDAYTAFVQETQRSVEAKQASVIDRASELSAAEQDLIQANSELGTTATELEALARTLADLQGSCGYTIKNFDARQAARDQEVQALRQARAFLSGMQ